jgi:hypothetical protein
MMEGQMSYDGLQQAYDELLTERSRQNRYYDSRYAGAICSAAVSGLLGKTVKEIGTGVSGVVTAVVEYLAAAQPAQAFIDRPSGGTWVNVTNLQVIG